MLTNILYQRIDNSQIVVFRIFFGLLMLAEGWGSIATGWVDRAFVEPEFTFTFIGFSWTQPLLGETMIYYYVALGFLGLMIALGAFYRVSTLLFALGWSLVYFMQKTSYNNHYYLVMLVAWFMVFIPANRYKSVDVWLFPTIKRLYTYQWNRLLFILQIAIVYVFAAFAKIYPDWINGKVTHHILTQSSYWFKEYVSWGFLTNFLQSERLALLIAWSGIAFDFLIVPFLLFKKTRKIAFFLALFFHLFNSVTLHIGIFPYFALALCVFCFPPQQIQRFFLPNKPVFRVGMPEYSVKPLRRFLFSILFWVYILWQIYLPIRHWLIPGEVLWTEEGHRLAWRMMLRSRTAYTTFYTVNKQTKKKKLVKYDDYLTDKQSTRVQSRPDMIWQFAQYIKKKHAERGEDIQVFVQSRVAINGTEFYPYIDPNIDLANTKWNYFGHQKWILDSPKSYSYFCE